MFAKMGYELAQIDLELENNLIILEELMKGEFFMKGGNIEQKN
ncbi:hypothetical protein P4V41_20735 [Fictibacillus nanhaiensis]|nr:hypothetical protein [Fictibacillus nanhaiensis]